MSELQNAPDTGKMGLLATLDDRTGLGAAWRAFTGRQQAGAPSLGRSLGALVGLLFVFECVTGVGLAFFYSPSATTAWASTAHIQTAVPLGALLRGLHYHATSVLFVAAGLYLAHLFALAAWRRPGEVSWFLAIAMMLVLPVFAITGNVLPMDQDGLHGVNVELAVIAAAPLGDSLKSLLIGGSEVGNATLPRFFALHALILPLVFAAVFIGHRVLARRAALAKGPGVPEFPGQSLRNVIVFAGALAIAFILAVKLGARLDAPGDPTTAFAARPEWYFVALNQINTMFGNLAAIVLPPLGIGLLFAVPLLDRLGKRSASGRPGVTVIVPVALLGLGFFGLTAKGLMTDASSESLAKDKVRIEETAAAALDAFRTHGVDGEGRLPFIAAQALYKDKGCAACHDKKKDWSPRLAGWATIERTSAFLAEPDSERFFKHTSLAGEMDAFSGTPEERDALARYLLHNNGLKGDPGTTPEILKAGRAAFFEDSCETCHNDPQIALRDKEYDFRAEGPDLNGYAGPEWTRALIRDAHHPTLFGSVVKDAQLDDLMPAYPDLSNDELDLLVRWLSAGAPGAK